MVWVKHTDANKAPTRGRLLLAYCPEWNNTGYAVVIWTGYAFKCETSDVEITDYVIQWALILEVE
jgi:hypothetical protein